MNQAQPELNHSAAFEIQERSALSQSINSHFRLAKGAPIHSCK